MCDVVPASLRLDFRGHKSTSPRCLIKYLRLTVVETVGIKEDVVVLEVRRSSQGLKMVSRVNTLGLCEYRS